eukprot:m.254366 g.254366  ORF g.254366 m.254366 type:complete len:480 (+) comp19603_c0_seq13:224-1663(+)
MPLVTPNMSSPRLCVFFALVWGQALCSSVVIADNTNWDTISPTLLRHWNTSLPPLPTTDVMDVSYWTNHESNGQFFQTIALDMSKLSTCQPIAQPLSWPNSSLYAGPLMSCGATGSLCNNFNSSSCKVADSLNGLENTATMISRHGTHWAKITSQPAWVQMRFPVPETATRVVLKIDLDQRYPPLLRGGNPCPNGSSTYNCSLCTTSLMGDEPWDFSVPAGVYILWTVPMLGHHIITGPVDAAAAYRAGDMNIRIESPASLNLFNESEVVATVFAFNQYPFSGELEDGVDGYNAGDPTRCSAEWTRLSSDDNRGNALLSITGASIHSMTSWNPTVVPASTRPRMFGTDATWHPRFVQSFFDSPCIHATSRNPGWGGQAGFPDFKSVGCDVIVQFCEVRMQVSHSCCVHARRWSEWSFWCVGGVSPPPRIQCHAESHTVYSIVRATSHAGASRRYLNPARSGIARVTRLTRPQRFTNTVQ